MDPRGQDPDYAFRRQQEKVKKRQGEIRTANAEIIEKHSGAMAAEAERIAGGGVDFSLFNLVMSRVDFTVIEPTPMNATRAMYEALWPFMGKMIRENIHMRGMLEKVSKGEEVLTSEWVRYGDLTKTSADPNVDAAKALEEIRQAAIKRRDMNLY